MEQTVTLPIWLFVILLTTALLLVLDRILFPGVRWYLRRRVNRLIEEVNTRLDIEIRPFQRTRKQALVDQLVYDEKVIEAMNNEGGDLVLACGDFGSKPERSELELARDVLDELKMPYYPVLGNHDALFSGEKEEALFREVFSLKQNSYHFAQKGIQFIGIDHGCGKAYGDNSVRPAVMAWLKETLASIPDDQPIIFFSHYPFAKGVKYRTKNADDVQGLFNGRKLLAMISGHFHGNTERRENGILMTTTACCSSLLHRRVFPHRNRIQHHHTAAQPISSLVGDAHFAPIRQMATQAAHHSAGFVSVASPRSPYILS